MSTLLNQFKLLYELLGQSNLDFCSTPARKETIVLVQLTTQEKLRAYCPNIHPNSLVIRAIGRFHNPVGQKTIFRTFFLRGYSYQNKVNKEIRYLYLYLFVCKRTGLVHYLGAFKERLNCIQYHWVVYLLLIWTEYHWVARYHHLLVLRWVY